MKREKGILGLGFNSHRHDGSQDDLVVWKSEKDALNTTFFYQEMRVLGWDIPVIYAKLKTGEYVIGDGHDTLCGTVVSYAEFLESIQKNIFDLQEEIESWNEMKSM